MRGLFLCFNLFFPLINSSLSSGMEFMYQIHLLHKMTIWLTVIIYLLLIAGPSIFLKCRLKIATRWQCLCSWGKLPPFLLLHNVAEMGWWNRGLCLINWIIWRKASKQNLILVLNFFSSTLLFLIFIMVSNFLYC